jgi:hypothetical protein
LLMPFCGSLCPEFLRPGRSPRKQPTSRLFGNRLRCDDLEEHSPSYSLVRGPGFLSVEGREVGIVATCRRSLGTPLANLAPLQSPPALLLRTQLRLMGVTSENRVPQELRFGLCYLRLPHGRADGRYSCWGFGEVFWTEMSNPEVLRTW